jgi:hypothetical protein
VKRTQPARGKPPERRTPLKRGGQLPRRTPIRPVSVRRAAENRLRAAMIGRLYPGRVALCAVNAPGCAQLADDIHEPLTRARGGSITDEANQLPACRHCHDVLTFAPESELGWAYDRGLLRHSGPISKPWEMA